MCPQSPDAGADLAAELDRSLDRDVRAVEEWESTALDQRLQVVGGRVVLFGAGSLGRQVLAHLRRDHIEPVCFSDNNRESWGRTIDGLEVLPPPDAAQRYGNSAAFLVTIWNERHRFAETYRQLSELGAREIVPVGMARWKYREALLPFYWEEPPRHVQQQATAVRSAMDVWADEFSRREYVAQIRSRLWADYLGLSAPVGGECYFPEDIFQTSPQECFIDCGAYDGSTIRSFLSVRQNAFDSILGLEPDPETYRKLTHYVADLPAGISRRIAVSPLAVSDRRGVVSFDATGTLISSISPTGKLEVDCAPLDELLADKRPTFIKMDIEGAEPEALAGARGILQKHHPVLAICLYHRQDHLWRLPQFIKDAYDGYQLFLRPYDCDGWQLVCYAVPTDRLPSGFGSNSRE